MRFLLNREGNISVFRVGVIFGILGIFTLGFGFLSLQLEIAYRSQPFNVPLYANATELSREQSPLRTTGQLVYYMVTGALPEDIAEFYQQELDKHLGQSSSSSSQDRQECVRAPFEGNFDTYIEGNGTIPYYYDCIFDNTFLDNTQVTKVRIHPGVRNDTTGLNLENSVVIIYDQSWSRP